MRPRPRGIEVHEDGSVEHGWVTPITSFVGELRQDCITQDVFMALENAGEEHANWNPAYRAWRQRWMERHDPSGCVRDEELPPLDAA